MGVSRWAIERLDAQALRLLATDENAVGALIRRELEGLHAAFGALLLIQSA